MGYAFIMGPCHTCRQPFTFHPHKVPSIRDAAGIRQPVCLNCMTRANALREKRGLDPHPIRAGAYEPCHETELT